MANILNVTPPDHNPDYGRNTIGSQQASNDNNNPRIQNPVDPSKVVRADGQQGGKTGAADQNAYGVIDYESNYGAFVKKLAQGTPLSALLENFMYSGLASLRQSGGAGAAALIDQFLSGLHFQSPEELAAFFGAQGELQTKFTGPFFDSLRNLLSHQSSDGLKEAVMAFLRSYNAYSSGEHLLTQLRHLTDDIEGLLQRHYREEFRELADSMNWQAGNGDTAYNTGVLNGRLIPFLSSYISRSHDYGAVREAIMLLVFHAVRYESGGKDQLMQLFERLAGNAEFEQYVSGDARAQLESLLNGDKVLAGRSFADSLAALISQGTRGQAGLENIQQFYTMLNGLLLNESVYMPLVHLLFPFQYKEKQVMSEAWIDPDAGRDGEDEPRKIKMYLKFDIQSVGKFEMALAFQDRGVDMQLFVPPALAPQSGNIKEKVGAILKKNGIDLKRLGVQQRVREGRVEEFFPEIREKERTVNVRI